MPKITRAKQKIFCDDVPATNVVAVFGSLKEGDPEFSKDPDAIQSLPAYGAGWAGATVLNQAPALQDMNALQYLFSRQLAYVFQNGIPEYDATTSYYVGSIVTNSSGLPYVSLINDNLGQSLTDASKWKILTLPDLKWNAQVNYALGDVAANSSGVLYASIANNNLNFPLTDTAKWQPLLKLESAALPDVMVSPIGYASGTNASPAAAILPQGGVTTQRLIAGVGFSSGTVASPAAAIFPNGVSKVDVQGSNSTAISVSTNIACNGSASNVFDYTYRASATRTIQINNLASGQTIAVLVTGLAGDVITFSCFSDAGTTAVTSKVAAYASMVMTTTQSLFNITRVTGSLNWAVITPYHGLS